MLSKKMEITFEILNIRMKNAPPLNKMQTLQPKLIKNGID